MSGQVCLHFSTLVFYIYLETFFKFFFLSRAPIFLHRSTMLRFIFTLQSESCVSPSSAHWASVETHWNSAHWLRHYQSVSDTHDVHQLCFLPQWQQISALIKSRGALLCLDKLLQALCLDGLILEPILALCMVVSFLFLQLCSAAATVHDHWCCK